MEQNIQRTANRYYRNKQNHSNSKIRLKSIFEFEQFCKTTTPRKDAGSLLETGNATLRNNVGKRMHNRVHEKAKRALQQRKHRKRQINAQFTRN